MVHAQQMCVLKKKKKNTLFNVVACICNNKPKNLINHHI